jgi:hypothetical protein
LGLSLSFGLVEFMVGEAMVRLRASPSVRANIGQEQSPDGRGEDIYVEFSLLSWNERY